MRPEPLPIDDVLPALLEVLSTGTRAVLQAPPGAGKTTRVPLALRGAPWLGDRRIVMLEPRRLATRAAARRMASQLGESVGETVGYRVRGDSKVGPRTRIEVVTEGVLTRLVLDDPTLEGIGAVLFDEFHERNLVADTGLALTLQAADLMRPDLRLLVMSATLDGAAIAGLLGGAPMVTAHGRAFPVETRYVARRDDQRLDGAMAAVIGRALASHEGDVLAFLPGMAEIRRTASALGGAVLPAGTVVHQLHGSLPVAEQDRAIAPSEAGTRKVVLATSVAETSLTIEGVRVVVDSGWSRVPRFSARTGMSRLETVRVAADAAEQRRGRAGRVAPGVCYRLWSEGEQAQLLPRRTPEILEADLAPLALDLAAAGIDDPLALAWLDAPPRGAFLQARELLRELGALDADGRLTTHGKTMARVPVHPRLAHLVLHGVRRGQGALACDIAALLGDRDLLRRDAAQGDTDLRTRIELLRQPRGADDPRVDRGRYFQLREEAARLRRETRAGDALTSVALAYPDRVARRRGAEPGRFLTRSGVGARVDERTTLATAEFLAIADTDGTTSEAKVYLAAPLTREEVVASFATDIAREREVRLDERTGRVVAQEIERLGAIVLATRDVRDPDPADVARALLDAVRRRGIAGIDWGDAARGFRERIAFARSLDPTWPDLRDDALLATLEDWLAPHLDGLRRLSEVDALDFAALLSGILSWQQRAALDRLAPTHLEVPTGSRIHVDYADPAAPAIAVRMQELFGASETPRVGDGRVAVTLHLLSPAHRPLQVTRDLAGFWRGSYAEVRKEMRGRYPRHPWPEDPLTAPPTKRTKPR